MFFRVLCLASLLFFLHFVRFQMSIDFLPVLSSSEIKMQAAQKTKQTFSPVVTQVALAQIHVHPVSQPQMPLHGFPVRVQLFAF